jgi:hypothetical protein
MVTAIRPGGLVLDLQVVRPHPVVEVSGHDLCDIDGEPLFVKADAATAAIDALVAQRRLLEQAVDDHDVRKHYATGTDLLDDLVGKPRRVALELVPLLRAIDGPCAIRERCRLRRLQAFG